MRYVAAACAGMAVALLLHAIRTPDVASMVGRYIGVHQDDEHQSPRAPRDFGWIPWVIGGAFGGLLVAQGDLLVGGGGRSPIPFGVLGGATGWFVFSVRRTHAAERRARSLRFELPVLADALALHIVSGESVASAIMAVASTTHGTGSDELAEALDRVDDGEEMGLSESLMTASVGTAHDDGRRLYELLAHAHTSGGKLADALIDLAADLRSELERDLTAESGKRMITTYGPVLVLMVPTALMFLLYPTLTGLRLLAGVP